MQVAGNKTLAMESHRDRGVTIMPPTTEGDCRGPVGEGNEREERPLENRGSWRAQGSGSQEGQVVWNQVSILSDGGERDQKSDPLSGE